MRTRPNSVDFFSVRNKIICIDDFERKGRSLSARDLFGLMSDLKERKGCKVVLILNEEALKDDDKDFKLYNEKVIDVSLDFAPSAAECVAIALKRVTPIDDVVRSTAVELGISNIRILKKIERLAGRVSSILGDRDPAVLKQAGQTLTLLTWCIFSDGEAPTIEFLTDKRSKDIFGLVEGEATEAERRWNALLDKLPFSHFDELDTAILKGVKRGYFDDQELADAATELENRHKAGRSIDAIQAVWTRFYGTFNDDKAALVREIVDIFRAHILVVSPTNLASALGILKALGHPEEATALLKLFTKSHADKPQKFFDLSEQDTFGRIDDPELRATFDEKFRSYSDTRNPVDVLSHIEEHQSWSPRDIVLLSNLSVDNWYALFKATQGKHLSDVVRASLGFARIVGAQPEWLEISRRAKEALTRIGRESDLNALRVRRFGITILT